MCCWQRGLGPAGGVDSLYRSVRVLPNKLQYDYNRRVVARKASAASGRAVDISRSLPDAGVDGISLTESPALPQRLVAIETVSSSSSTMIVDLEQTVDSATIELDVEFDADEEDTAGDAMSAFAELPLDSTPMDGLSYLFEMAQQGYVDEVADVLLNVEQLFTRSAAFQLLLSKPAADAPFADFDALFTATDGSSVAASRVSIETQLAVLRDAIAACARIAECFQDASGAMRLGRGDVPLLVRGAAAVVTLNALAAAVLHELEAKAIVDALAEDAATSRAGIGGDDVTSALLESVQETIESFAEIPQLQLEQAQTVFRSIDSALAKSMEPSAVTIRTKTINTIEVDTDYIDAMVDVVESIDVYDANTINEAAATTLEGEFEDSTGVSDAESAVVDVVNESVSDSSAIPPLNGADLFVAGAGAGAVSSPDAPSGDHPQGSYGEGSVRTKEGYYVFSSDGMDLLFDGSVSTSYSSASDTDAYTYTGTASDETVYVETTAQSVESKGEQIIRFVVTAFDVSLFLVETLVKAVGPALKTGGVQVGKRVLSTYRLDEVLRQLQGSSDAGGSAVPRESWGVYEQFVNWKMRANRQQMTCGRLL